ncbi:hypothetical protein NP493_216g01037 [Ridgeia piscesae]|uniref:Uncharacterized protein n=1 Tax=Ridgeia piscesae TaxID=27915 RepID=A0AAD9UE23_RIDPI|nr:hypothetical protein NP493_216g01037 [Ridgeia piscesae]
MNVTKYNVLQTNHQRCLTVCQRYSPIWLASRNSLSAQINHDQLCLVLAEMMSQNVHQPQLWVGLQAKLGWQSFAVYVRSQSVLLAFTTSRHRCGIDRTCQWIIVA